MDPPRSGKPALPPAVDDHIVRPESREELLHGKSIHFLPGGPTRAQQLSTLAYLLKAHAAAGYIAALMMLARTAHDCDFAPDASIYPAAADPTTGGRQLEELAFLVCNEQALEIPTSKARELTRRGVRRVFCILVDVDEQAPPRKPQLPRRWQSRVLEWSGSVGDWSPLAETTAITDRCLVVPLSWQAFFDAAASDDAVSKALQERALVRGKARGRAAAILEILEERGFAISKAARKRILACTDLDQLKRWTRQSVTVARVRDLK